MQFRSVDTLFYYALCHIKVYIHLNIIVKLLNRLGIENNQNHMVYGMPPCNKCHPDPERRKETKEGREEEEGKEEQKRFQIIKVF